MRNAAFLRPSDIAYSRGDPGKAERLLGRKATKKHDVAALLVDAERKRRAQ